MTYWAAYKQLSHNKRGPYFAIGVERGIVLDFLLDGRGLFLNRDRPRWLRHLREAGYRVVKVNITERE